MYRMQLAGLVVGIGFALWYPTHTHAAMFGLSEDVHTIQATKSGEYNLCHKTSTYFFFAGLYVRDDGYVLQEAGKRDTYIPLDDATLARLQKDGELPSKLPPYTISLFDYLFGYSLWIILAVIIGSSLVKRAWAKAEPSAPVAQANNKSVVAPLSSQSKSDGSGAPSLPKFPGGGA